MAKKCAKNRDPRAKLLFYYCKLIAFFAFLDAVARRCCLSSLFLSSQNFATMVTWLHTSPLCLRAHARKNYATVEIHWKSSWGWKTIPITLICAENKMMKFSSSSMHFYELKQRLRLPHKTRTETFSRMRISLYPYNFSSFRIGHEVLLTGWLTGLYTKNLSYCKLLSLMHCIGHMIFARLLTEICHIKGLSSEGQQSF